MVVAGVVLAARREAEPEAEAEPDDRHAARDQRRRREVARHAADSGAWMICVVPTAFGFDAARRARGGSRRGLELVLRVGVDRRREVERRSRRALAAAGSTHVVSTWTAPPAPLSTITTNSSCWALVRFATSAVHAGVVRSPAAAPRPAAGGEPRARRRRRCRARREPFGHVLAERIDARRVEVDGDTGDHRYFDAFGSRDIGRRAEWTLQTRYGGSRS